MSSASLEALNFKALKPECEHDPELHSASVRAVPVSLLCRAWFTFSLLIIETRLLALF